MKILLTILFGVLLNHAIGQIIFSQVQDGKAFVNHVVKKGEGAYGISKMYQAGYDDFLQLNSLQKEVILQEGMILKIPLSGILKQVCKGDSCIPVHYKVQQSEGLYRIGKNHGDIKVPALKQLNHLNAESVSMGQELLVGYIVVPGKVFPVNDLQEVLTNETAIIEKPVNTTPQPTEIKPEKPAEPVQGKPAAAKKLIGDTLALIYRGKGSFETSFKDSENKKLLKCATFKSESGWADGKFYALVDGIETGTILRVKNPLTGFEIFAKILGPLPQVKHADKIQIRISSAGMIALGFMYDDLFEIEINY